MLVLRACFSLIVSGAGGRYPSELCGQIVLYSCRVWGSEVRVPHRPPNVNCTREALSITWEQVDSDNRTVTVGESKTDAGTGRNIPLDQTLLGRLTALSAKHYQLQMLYRDWNPTGFVFCTSAGKRGDKDNLQKYVLTPMLKEAGLPHFTWHHLRHNAGSYLLSENVPITAVSKILGHANPAITMSIFAHELVEDLEPVLVAMAKFA